MADADTFQRHRGLVDLPPAVLERIVSAAWAPSARAPSASSRTSGGVAALCSLSVACRTLRAACDASLAELAEAIGGGCPALEVLRLDSCQHISGNGLEAMAACGGLRCLRELSLASCGDVGQGAFLRHLPALRVLRAPYCRSLCTEEVAGAAPALHELDLEGCDAVGDELCFFFSPALRAANLAFLPLSDAGLAALAANARGLRRLTLARRSMNLWTTGHYQDASLAALRRALPGLQIAFTM